MKNLFLTVLSVLAFAGSAFAETSAIRVGSALGDRGQTAVLTNAVPASSTESTNVGSGVDLREWKNVALQVSFAGAAGTNATATLTFVRTATRLGPADSGVVWETTPAFTWVVSAGTASGTVVGVTNLPNDSFSGLTGLKLKSIASGTNALSGITLTVNRKR